MKKFLLTTTAVLTILFAQAQVSYCDSIDISITSQTMTDITLSSGLNVNMIPGIVSNTMWTHHNDSGFVIGLDTLLSPTFNLPNPMNSDTNSFCFQVIIDINGFVYACNVCDTIVWNGTSWMMKTGQATVIDELNSPNRELLKVVDMLGRNANGNKNEPLFYIYDDGTVEKRIIIK